MEGWLDSLCAAGRRLHASPGWIGIEFSDGCDAWWLATGDPEPWMPAEPAVAACDAVALATRFGQLDGRRARCLHALRNHLAGLGWWFRLVPCGEMAVQSPRGMSTTIPIGGRLTALVGGEHEVAPVLAALLVGGVVKAPEAAAVASLLAAPAVADPPPYPPDDEASPLATPRGVLELMGFCRVVRRIDGLADDLSAAGGDPGREQALAARVRRVARPRADLAEALERLADRLSGVGASLELTTGVMHLEHGDGFDSYAVDPRSPAFRALVKRLGPVAAGDHLADEFLRLGRERAMVLTAVRGEAQARGWLQDRDGAGLHFGRVYREVSIDPGAGLSERLRTADPATVLAQACGGDPGFAAAAQGRLGAPALPPPAEGSLPPEAPRPVEVPEVDGAAASASSALAAQLVARALAGERALDLYLDRERWDGDRDRWCDAATWRRLADAALTGDQQWNVAAQRVRLDQGCAQAEAWWDHLLATDMPHHDLGDAEVVVAWARRRRHPAMAVAMFGAQAQWSFPYPEIRAAAGDPPAIRFLVAQWQVHGPSWPVLARIPAALLRRMAGDEVVVGWHRAALRWAAETWNWESPDAGIPAAAAAQGWDDVAAALEANPYLPGGLFAGEGVPFGAGAFLAAWARLRSHGLVRRLAAQGLGQLEQFRARARVQAAVLMGPDAVEEAVGTWMAELELDLAIAWSRCAAPGEAVRP